MSVNIYSASHHQVSSFAASNLPETVGFGRFAPPVEVDDDKHDEDQEEEESVSEENSEFISSAELRRNRMRSKG